MATNKLKYVEETSKNFHAGMLSFVFQRVSGLALVFYLIMHMYSLSSILGGTGSFKEMMDAYNSPLFHFAEWLVLAAVAFHMLNGIRIIAVGIHHPRRRINGHNQI